MQWAGKTVWIIGASSGIGRALAVALHGRGARLVLSSRSAAKLEALQAQLGPQHKVVAFDIAQPQAAARAINDLAGLGILPDSVICMAGHYQPMALRQLDMSAARNIIETNLMGTLEVVAACLPQFLARGHGQLALCGSVSAYSGLPNAQPYGATKAAIMNLAESLRSECAGTGVDIKLISPGFVETPMTAKNKFAMPAIISAEAAAQAIVNGLGRAGFEIHFPKRFTLLVKLLRSLPYSLYFRLVRKFK